MKTTNHYVGTILISDDDKFVLQLRDNDSQIANPGQISLFGGGANDNEDPVVALKRELLEEIGFDFQGSFSLFLTLELINQSNLSKEMFEIYTYNEKIDILNLHLFEGQSFVKLDVQRFDNTKYNLSPISAISLKEYSRLRSQNLIQ